MGIPMKGLEKMKTLLPTLSPADRQITQFLMEYPQELRVMSSSELAKAIGVGQSTIVKFSQKIGYRGYSDMKLNLYENNLTYQSGANQIIHGSITRSDSITLVMEKLLASKYEALERTVLLNEGDSLHRAASALHMAGKIQIAGVGASSLVAKDLAYKLMKIGHSVSAEHDAHVQIANASTLREGDVLVALSYSGRSNEVLKVAKLARNKGVQVITISQLVPTPLDKLADIKLVTAADEERIRSSSITARDSQLLLTDLLFIAVTQLENQAEQFIEQGRSAVATLKQ